MKQAYQTFILFFIRLYNFLVKDSIAYDVELRCMNDPELGPNCTEFGTFWIYPLKISKYEYIVRSSNGLKEKSGTLILKRKKSLNNMLLLKANSQSFLYGKLLKMSNGNFYILGPGYIKNKPLMPHEFIFFEKIKDIPKNI